MEFLNTMQRNLHSISWKPVVLNLGCTLESLGEALKTKNLGYTPSQFSLNLRLRGFGVLGSS